ncbi:hypothetical protein NPS33_18985 [Pseudomonas putida]|uniref:hypothetical protein n=1 Tax=Pseudomonas putida TaxID=303 RepID=UPI0023632BB8|nr:hypothetical protein [Pseudomonas putida]MDD2016980.1 hypothetical protein [Pseudomonas putida]HDS1772858.1 hypothetical protein [Pseudomonas putida]
MQQSDKNPNVVVREITQVLQDFYKERIVPDALASGLDPVELFNKVVDSAVKAAVADLNPSSKGE